MILLGISGKAETGKDYLQSTVLQPLGFRPWSLAWHFKVWLVGQGHWTHAEVFQTKPEACRTALQQVGTEQGRMVYGEDIWCGVAMEWLRVIGDSWGQSRFVIPDVRFKNEVLAIQRAGGYVVRLDAPERAARNRLTPEQRAHVSETDLDVYDSAHPIVFDGIIHNDVHDAVRVGSLPRQMESFFDKIGQYDLATQVWRNRGGHEQQDSFI